MTNILNQLHRLVWGVPLLVLILSAGIYMTVRTGFPQFALFPKAVRQLFSRSEEKNTNGNITPFQALCTALAATVGTGNLIGVAGAICIGGPGAVFWMWICGLIGMATKFSEAILAIRFRIQSGEAYLGGPMYMISQGLRSRWHWLAAVYCVLGIISSFGVGNAVQINSVVSGANAILRTFGYSESILRNLIFGLLLAVLLGFLLCGGTQRIARTAERLVPVASLGYILLCLVLLIQKHSGIPHAFHKIVFGAFHPKAITGGAVGSLYRTLCVGCARGVFTNEAGIGTASMAYASSRISHPVEQGMLGLVEVFVDTIVICTLTALAILCSGTPIPFGTDAGVGLTASAFSLVFGSWITILLTGFLCIFAFATVLGWGIYGVRCFQFLFGMGSGKFFVVFHLLAVLYGACFRGDSVWKLAEILNGCMAIPNLIALVLLSPELARLVKDYKKGG